MNKYYNSAIAKKVIQDTAKSGIKTAVNIIVGHPGENKKEFKKTIKFLKKNKEYINQITNVSTCFINPSASLGLNPEKYGIVLKDTNNLFDKIKALAGRVLDLMLFSKESWDYAEHSGLKKYFFREINYSDFYDIYGNTPLTRRKKLFKMLSCIYKMNLPVIIVNKPIAVDKKLEKIINKVTDFNKKALSKFKAFKDIKIVQADTGVQIYYKGSEITKKFGINSSLFTKNQGWVDSSWAVWNFNKSNKKNVISAKVIWNKIPVVQLWQIKIINSEKIYLKIIMEVKKDFYLSIRKVGILINDKYDVFEYANNKSIFPDFQKDWSVINLNQPGLDKITVKNSKSDIPDLTVKFLNNNFNCGFQIETGDRRTRAKIISLVEKHNNFIKITKGSYPYFEGLMSFS
jgi:hypothetical protein